MKNSAAAEVTLSGEQAKIACSDNPPLPDLMAAPLGLPLIAAYSYMKKHGFREFLENRGFVSQEVEVITILRKASELLKPLGITRDDLESILDKRHGVTGSYPVDGSR